MTADGAALELIHSGHDAEASLLELLAAESIPGHAGWADAVPGQARTMRSIGQEKRQQLQCKNGGLRAHCCTSNSVSCGVTLYVKAVSCGEATRRLPAQACWHIPRPGTLTVTDHSA